MAFSVELFALKVVQVELIPYMCYKFIYFVLLIVLLSLLFIFLHFLLYPMLVNSVILLYYFVMLFSKVF